jgi:hypothetical protein
MRRPTPLIAAAAALALAAATRAPAAELFGEDSLHGFAELRLAGADAERGWLDGRFGKAGVSGGAHGGWRGKADLSQAVFEWRPRLSFALGAVVSAQYQAGVHPGLDLDEAYLQFKAPPSPAGRLSLRAGLFYPPVSLEHGGPGWTTTELLSASALNSWIGEEVKVVGAEATWRRRLGAHELSASGALFGWNDTSGTLLTFRGWALHGVRSGPQTEFELPPLSAFMRVRQADETYPQWELDHRVGWYGRLEWRPPAPMVLAAFHYDNRGNRIAVRELQWSWETRFDVASLDWRPTATTRVRAQALAGRTWMGYATPQTWADVSFRSGYVMATRALGADGSAGAASLRLDAFDARDHTWIVADDNAEHGWAATAGLRRPLAPWADLLLEAQRIDSTRSARALAGEPPHKVQTVLQSAVRLHF